MGAEGKPRIVQDHFLEAIRTEVITGTEILSSWINHVQARNRLDLLFEFETWLRGICAFFDYRHLPLSESARAMLVTRDFAPEIGVARQALQECERCAVDLCLLGDELPGEAGAGAGPNRADSGPWESQVGVMREQLTPVDSLTRLMESINDLKVLMDGLRAAPRQQFQLFVSLSRVFRRALHNCRFLDMLLLQQFRPQYDSMDNAVLSAVLRSVAEEQVRRNLALALLYLYRFLRYLTPVTLALREDRPLRRTVVVFSLLHEQGEVLCEFLRSRFLKELGDHPELRVAANQVSRSLRTESQRACDCELAPVASSQNAAEIYAAVENCHGLLHACYQSGVITLVRALDADVDATSLFPSMASSQQDSQRLQKDLWDLRQFLNMEMEKSRGLDLDRILGRVSEFRESSLQYLMYKDWGEFERFSESLITAGSLAEVGDLVAAFVAFLESLMRQISQRRVLRNSSAEFSERGPA